MWFESPQKRLASWRNFRKGLDINDLLHTCRDVCEWWRYAPLSNISLDPYDIETWPSVWEMLHRGDYCKFSTAIGMSYTLFYIDQKGALLWCQYKLTYCCHSSIFIRGTIFIDIISCTNSLNAYGIFTLCTLESARQAGQ